MASIIISHTMQDTESAQRLAHSLEQYGHAICLDQWDLESNRFTPKGLSQFLDRIDFMIVLLSHQAAESSWLEHDWKKAYWGMLHTNEVPVLPVSLDQLEVPELFQEENGVSLFESPEGGIRELQSLIEYYTQKQLLKNAKAVPDPGPERKERSLEHARENRNKHWDRVQEFIDSLQGQEKLRIQKLNTAYYLEYYHLTVAHLKECLHYLGAYDGAVDNQLDADLIFAIIQFQTNHDLPHIDGIFGPLSYAALKEAILEP